MNRPLSVVLVDDNHDDNFFHSKIIQRAGIPATVRSFRDGTEALEYLATPNRDPVDMILLDIVMPRMNGFEFVSEFERLPRALRVGVVVYLLSVSARPEHRDRARNLSPVRGFLDKPLRTETVYDVVDEYFPTLAGAVIEAAPRSESRSY